ncbi:MAG: hypothetical protein KAY32_10785 [Candidatus Eisenbacteria sp.]|nr:hypothetical protein [Candidatus Eisenbacteria bacterium]
MNRIQALGIAAWAWRATGAVTLRPLLWLPFVFVAALQLGALLLLVGFHRPLLLPLGLPLVDLLGGEPASHYPLLYYQLPAMFFKLNLVISTLFASVAAGAGTLLFARSYGYPVEEGIWERTLRCAPRLIAVTLIVVACLLGVTLLASLVPREAAMESLLVRWGLRGALLGLFILLQSLLIYTTPWIVLLGHRIGPAIRDSVRVTLRTLFPTLIAVGIPLLLLFPFSYVTGRVDLLAGQLRPELIATLLGLQVVCQMLVTFFLIGGVTRLFLWRVEAAR